MLFYDIIEKIIVFILIFYSNASGTSFRSIVSYFSSVSDMLHRLINNPELDHNIKGPSIFDQLKKFYRKFNFCKFILNDCFYDDSIQISHVMTYLVCIHLHRLSYFHYRFHLLQNIQFFYLQFMSIHDRLFRNYSFYLSIMIMNLLFFYTVLQNCLIHYFNSFHFYLKTN